MIANRHDIAEHPQQQRVRRIPGRVRDPERPGGRYEISAVSPGIQPCNPTRHRRYVYRQRKRKQRHDDNAVRRRRVSNIQVCKHFRGNFQGRRLEN